MNKTITFGKDPDGNWFGIENIPSETVIAEDPRDEPFWVMDDLMQMLRDQDLPDEDYESSVFVVHRQDGKWNATHKKAGKIVLDAKITGYELGEMK